MSIFPTKILLATDGSESASQAAKAAANFAKSTRSELHVAVAAVMPNWFFAEAEAEYGKEEEYYERKAVELLEQEVGKLESLGAEVAGSHYKIGEADVEVVELAEELEAGLVVVGSRGNSPLKRAVLGSVSDSIVRHAHCPVLVVRGSVAENLFPSKVVLAVDGSQESEAAASTTVELVKSTGTELHVIHAGPTASESPYPSSYRAESAESFFERKFLEDKVQQLKEETGSEVHAHFTLGKPEKKIVEFAEEVEADLIILGSRGHGGVKRALMGSVSDAVVRHAHCPIMVVR